MRAATMGPLYAEDGGQYQDRRDSQRGTANREATALGAPVMSLGP